MRWLGYALSHDTVTERLGKKGVHLTMPPWYFSAVVAIGLCVLLLQTLVVTTVRSAHLPIATVAAPSAEMLYQLRAEWIAEIKAWRIMLTEIHRQTELGWGEPVIAKLMKNPEFLRLRPHLAASTLDLLDKARPTSRLGKYCPEIKALMDEVDGIESKRNLRQ